MDYAAFASLCALNGIRPGSEHNHGDVRRVARRLHGRDALLCGALPRHLRHRMRRDALLLLPLRLHPANTARDDGPVRRLYFMDGVERLALGRRARARRQRRVLRRNSDAVRSTRGVILCAVTSFSVFILPHHDDARVIALFAFAIAAAGFLSACCWAAFGAALEKFFRARRRLLNGAMALLLVWCALSQLAALAR